MRSIAELSTDPNTTKVATTGVTDMQPTQWAKEVVLFGEALRLLDQVIWVRNDIVGTKDEALVIPTQESHLDITTSPIDTTYPEGTVRNFTIMSNTGTQTFTILNTDFLKGGISIGKELFMTCSLDLIGDAKRYIAEDIADDVDLAIATMLQSTSVTNQLWGGDATQVEDLTAGDVLTTDLIADARRQIAVNNFVAKFMIISPFQEATLLKDSQFVNAAEYGSDRIVLKGEIGNYLGLSVIVTTNANLSYDTSATEVNENAAVGFNTNVVPVVGVNRSGQKAAGAIVWKEKPHIDMEFEKNEARHLIFYDQAFTTGILHVEAISLIKVTRT